MRWSSFGHQTADWNCEVRAPRYDHDDGDDDDDERSAEWSCGICARSWLLGPAGCESEGRRPSSIRPHELRDSLSV